MESGAQCCQQLRAEHGMPTQREKIVVDSNPFHAQKALPNLGYSYFHFVGWGRQISGVRRD